MSEYISGEFDVKDISFAPFGEILFGNGDFWYKAKVVFLSIDERTGKEKRSGYTYLVQADTIKSAVKAIDTFMNDAIIDYRIQSICETKIVDVIQLKSDNDG